ncbi:MAG: hypothetical protein GY859_33575, partial [Desulfobacterales bacterium]|nr:hypothetical protein [Desulfobacterales bacterium]
MAACPSNGTVFAIYTTTGTGGVGDLSKAWILNFFEWWEDQDGGVTFAELGYQDVRNCNLADHSTLKLYVQPGGNAYKQQKKLGADGKATVLDLINNSSKAYLGICAGFFYSAPDYYWQGSYYDWQYLLGAFQTVEGSITEIADYDESPGYAVTSVDTDDGYFRMTYYGGPTLGMEDTSGSHPGTDVITLVDTQDELTGGLTVVNGNKKMLLLTVHPEAMASDISGLSLDQQIENYKWLANQINDIAGTSFSVPSYASYECNDGVDNDSDGDADFPNDAGCDSPLDDDETDPVASCSDNFESGDLGNWTLSGPGDSWQVTTETVYAGSYAARAKRSGAGDDSFMEMSINSCGTTFSYYRRLKGLDRGDDFEASYYNNGAWTS